MKAQFQVKNRQLAHRLEILAEEESEVQDAIPAVLENPTFQPVLPRSGKHQA